jgi:hypothetical protein
MTEQMHIAEYDEMANKLDEVKEYSNFLPDVSSDEGYQKSKRVSLDIGKIKTSLEKTRKEKKSFFLEGGKQVDSQAKKILEKLDAMQLPHLTAYKELDNLKKEREAKRKQELEDRVAYIRNLPEMLSESCSDEIQGAMNDMSNESCETFYEFTSAALKARNETIKVLGDLFTKTLKAEKDAEELEKLRAEQAKRKQEEHEARIANQAKEEAERVAKIAQDKIKAEKQQAIQREEQAKQAVIEAELKAEAQAKQARQNEIDAENARIEAVKQAEERAKQFAIDAENKRLADIEQAKQDEINRQKEQLRLERAEAEKREANKKYLAKVHNGILSVLIANGISENDGKTMIKLAAKNELPQLTINY